MNADNGTLATQKIGRDLIEYGEYFPFAGAEFPGKIEYSLDGVRKLEITQTMAELNDATENVLAAPANASVRVWCKTFKRPSDNRCRSQRKGAGGGTST